MKKVAIVCAALGGLLGCTTGGNGLPEMSLEERVAFAFPNPADRESVFMAIPQGNISPPQGFRVGFYSDEITEVDVAQRLQSYCSANGYGSVVVGNVRGGSRIIQEDDSLKSSRNGVFTCG